MKAKIALFSIIAINLLGWTVALVTSRDGQSKVPFRTQVLNTFDTLPPIHVSALVKTDNELHIFPRDPGVVTGVYAHEGEYVKKGQVIAAIDLPKDAHETYSELKFLADYRLEPKLLKEYLAQAQSLYDSGVYSAYDLLEKQNYVLRFARDTMRFQSELQRFRQETEGRLVVAPFNAIVARQSLIRGRHYEGDRADEAPVVLQGLKSTLSVELKLPPDVVPLVQVGDPIEVSLALANSKSFSGEITRIASIVSEERVGGAFVPAIASLTVEGAANRSLISGSKAVATVFPKSAEKGLWVPRAALDVILEDRMVDKTLDLTASMERSIEIGEKKDLIQEQAPASRNLASEAMPNESSIREFYMLTQEEKVVKVIVNEGLGNSDAVFIATDQLLGSEVIVGIEIEQGLWTS